jgi:hypothetical protein
MLKYDGRFSAWLNATILKHKDVIEDDHGVTIGDLGTHSIRKGAATYLQSLSNGPSITYKANKFLLKRASISIA